MTSTIVFVNFYQSSWHEEVTILFTHYDDDDRLDAKHQQPWMDNSRRA